MLTAQNTVHCTSVCGFNKSNRVRQWLKSSCTVLRLLISTTTPEQAGMQKKDQMFNAKHLFWLQATENCYGMKEWERSNPFVSNSVRILREEQLRNHFSVARICVWVCQALWSHTYSENSPHIQAAAYSTSQIPFLWVLLAMRWALSSSMAIWETANLRIAFTLIATSNIWAAIRCPCRVPSNRVSSTKMLMYLQEVGGIRFCHQAILHCHCWWFQSWHTEDWPLKVGDVLVIGLTTDIDDFSQQLVPIRRPFCFIHVDHQFLHYLHQVLLWYLLKELLLKCWLKNKIFPVTTSASNSIKADASSSMALSLCVKETRSTPLSPSFAGSWMKGTLLHKL